MYFDYNLDESYTPSKIVLSAGTGLYDLTEVQTIDLHQPRGWQTVNVGISVGSTSPVRQC